MSTYINKTPKENQIVFKRLTNSLEKSNVLFKKKYLLSKIFFEKEIKES